MTNHLTQSAAARIISQTALLCVWLSFLILTPLFSVSALSNDQIGPYYDQKFILNVPIGNVSKFTIFNTSNNILGKYIQAWYGFLIGTVGIIATVMIMWGGFKFLTSRGDRTMVSNAQSIIISAITGLVLAFGSYTILYLINPNLLTIRVPALQMIVDNSGINLSEQALAKGASGSTNNNTPCYVNTATGACALPPSLASSNYNWDNKNVDPKLLKAIAAQENGGDPTKINTNTNGTKDYSLTQINSNTLPDLLKAKADHYGYPNYTGNESGDTIGAWITQNPQVSIDMTANYLIAEARRGGWDVTNPSADDIAKTAATYNGGSGALTHLNDFNAYINNVTKYYNSQ